ncbi:MAG: DUF2892 domain-containing protein [Rhodocyclales bacterium GT-UBC]|nr:MAG: DUF2892 domain-containing protein [Rhodocyclales bacterium GT-UBC]
MKSNVGGLDKILRIAAGLGLIGATAAGVLPAWGYIGVVPLITGLMGWCPIYPILGLSTCPIKK